MTAGAATSPFSVVLLVRSLNYGGAERQVVELAKGLMRAGHRVAVVVFYSEGRFIGELRESGVHVFELAKRGRWDLMAFVPRLVRLLRAQDPAVVYAFMVEPSLLAVLLKPMLNDARVVWGVRVSNIDFARYGWFPRWTFTLSCRLARFADLVIANSWAGAAHHQELGYPAAKMAVVPNGVDVTRFRPEPAAGRRQRAAWGLPEGVRAIGLVGRLDPMKDHATFLRAARLVHETSPDVRFVCVGEGPSPYRAELEKLAGDLGVAPHVFWVGGQSDMAATYNALDVFCLSSAYGEGFSNALAEAMACGLPCVATDVGDAARIVDQCAAIVPPGDPARLADALRDALSQAARGTTGVCRRRVEELFSVERMVSETERLLRMCVDAS